MVGISVVHTNSDCGGVMKNIYWKKYLKECKKTGSSVSLKDYQIWLQDNNLVDEELEDFYEQNYN
jgi:hypothetical protein